jgi:hypothetical protein
VRVNVWIMVGLDIEQLLCSSRKGFCNSTWSCSWSCAGLCSVHQFVHSPLAQEMIYPVLRLSTRNIPGSTAGDDDHGRDASIAEPARNVVAQSTPNASSLRRMIQSQVSPWTPRHLALSLTSVLSLILSIKQFFVSN